MLRQIDWRSVDLRDRAEVNLCRPASAGLVYRSDSYRDLDCRRLPGARGRGSQHLLDLPDQLDCTGVRWRDKSVGDDPGRMFMEGRFQRSLADGDPIGRYEEARAEFKLAIEQFPESAWRDCVAELCIAMVEERLGQQGVLSQTVERWEAEPDKRKVAPFPMAVRYVQLGDHERALDWLESSYERDPSGLVEIKVRPFFDPLHGHPRFQKLLAKLGLADPP